MSNRVTMDNLVNIEASLSTEEQQRLAPFVLCCPEDMLRLIQEIKTLWAERADDQAEITRLNDIMEEMQAHE